MTLISVIADIVLVLVVIVGIVLGIKRGFVKTVAKPVKLVATLVIAFSACSAVATNIIEPIIKTPIANQLSDYMYEKCAHITVDNVATELPTLLKMAAGMFGINVEEVAQTSVTSVLDAIVEALTSPIIHLVSVIVAFVLLYIAARIVLSIVIAIINAILNAGVLGIVNKALGFLFGGAFALIIAWALVVVAEFVMGFVNYDFEAGYIYNLLNNLNPLDLLLSF